FRRDPYPPNRTSRTGPRCIDIWIRWGQGRRVSVPFTPDRSLRAFVRMRISTKLILLLVTAVVCVMAVYAIVTVSRTQARLDEELLKMAEHVSMALKVGTLQHLEEEGGQEGIVEIKGVARKPGVKSKVAVASRDRNVDPRGACIGNRGLRIREITRELSKLLVERQREQSSDKKEMAGERVDIVRWSPDIKEFIAEALQPAKVEEVIVEEESEERCVVRVIVPDDQVSQAIGKEGVNVWLAAKLVESVRTRGSRGRGFQCKIDIKPVSEWLKEQMGKAEAEEGIVASSETVEAASGEGSTTASAGERNVAPQGESSTGPEESG
ncbi:MAG TPA: hypothetical protein EYP65_04760, partial [Armatimonadetes bacterium]|nr:hypothetical protein [Armatimonadota bacterium]